MHCGITWRHELTRLTTVSNTRLPPRQKLTLTMEHTKANLKWLVLHVSCDGAPQAGTSTSARIRSSAEVDTIVALDDAEAEAEAVAPGPACNRLQTARRPRQAPFARRGLRGLFGKTLLISRSLRIRDVYEVAAAWRLTCADTALATFGGFHNGACRGAVILVSIFCKSARISPHIHVYVYIYIHTCVWMYVCVCACFCVDTIYPPPQKKVKYPLHCSSLSCNFFPPKLTTR